MGATEWTDAQIGELIADARQRERRRIARELQDLATNEELRLRRAHRIGPVGNLPAPVNNWVGGIRLAARRVWGPS